MQQGSEPLVKDSENTESCSVIIQESFYSDKLQSYVLLLAIGIAIIAALFFVVSYIFATNPKPHYFRTDDSGQVFKHEPLDNPEYNPAQIKDWASQAVIKIFNFNFLNYNSEVNINKNLFTEQAFNKYLNQLKTVELPTIAQGKFVEKLSLCDVAKIDQNTSGVFLVDNQNRYVWTIFLPVYIQYQNKNNKYTVVTNILVRIQRDSSLIYPDGLVISDISFNERVNVANNSSDNLPVCNG